MRVSALLILLVAACGEKKAPEPAPAAPEPAPAVAPEPEPTPEPEPPPPPPPPKNNADFNLSVTFADGTVKSGHVKRVERSTDWYGDDGWETDANMITLSLEGNGTIKDATWSEIASISVTPGKVPADVDCTYSSETQPWTYICELRTPTTATTKDGKKWTVTSRQKWRFTFDDDSSVEFWLAKHPARMQDDKVVTLEDDNGGENYGLYTQLQDQLRKEVGTLPKTITVK